MTVRRRIVPSLRTCRQGTYGYLGSRKLVRVELVMPKSCVEILHSTLLLTATPDVIEAVKTCVMHPGTDQMSLLFADFQRKVI